MIESAEARAFADEMGPTTYEKRPGIRCRISRLLRSDAAIDGEGLFAVGDF